MHRKDLQVLHRALQPCSSCRLPPPCHCSRLGLGERQVLQSRRLSFHMAPTSVLLNKLQTLQQQLCRLYHHGICGFPPVQRQLPLNWVLSAEAGKQAQGTARACRTLQVIITQQRGKEVTCMSTSRQVTFSICPLLPLHSYRCKQARSLRGQDHLPQSLQS